MKLRFFEWDYRTGLVTEFKRNGECKQCGLCCTFRIAFTTCGRPYKGDHHNGGKEPNGSGVWQEANRGQWRYFYQITDISPEGHRCHACGEDNLCSLQNDKPGPCRDWPMSPVCIAQFPDCGFRFETIGTWKISETKQSSEKPE